MNPIEWIFSILENHVPMNLARKKMLKDEAEKWYTSDETEKHFIGRYVKKYGEVWWVQLLLAVSYIFAVKWINDILNEKVSDDDDDESI